MGETGGRRATCLEKCAGVPGAGVPGAAASWKDDMASVTPSSSVLVKAEPTIARILLRRVPGPLQPPRLIQVGIASAGPWAGALGTEYESAENASKAVIHS